MYNPYSSGPGQNASSLDEAPLSPSRKTLIVPDAADVGGALCRLVEECSKKAISQHGKFNIGLSGGSVVTMLTGGMHSITTDWSKWRLFFCDERVVPFSSEESTFNAYMRAMSGTKLLQKEQFVTINPTLPVEECAADYFNKLLQFFPSDGAATFPVFDLLLLGAGPDGHTCSLFPGHMDTIHESRKWIVGVTNSPKPPPCRITMTLPLINSAKCCAFAMAGKEKAPIVRRIITEKDQSLPAALVHPKLGQLVWILDQDAASQL